MLGAIIGDIIGSRYEFNNIHTTDFPLFGPGCAYTDDTILTIAIADALLSRNQSSDCLPDFKGSLIYYGTSNMDSHGRYGGMFYKWLTGSDRHPYNSFGNGSAMRVSACASLFRHDREKALSMAASSCMCTHNHPEGIKGAMAITDCILMAFHNESKEFMHDFISDLYGYDLDEAIPHIREWNYFNETCQITVPQAIKCYLESDSFESAIRLAVSIGGDSDTIAGMCGAIAEAGYGIPTSIKDEAMSYLPQKFIDVIEREYKHSNLQL